MASPDELFALLIGADDWDTESAPVGGASRARACVEDVRLLERTLKTRVGIRDERIVTLTSGARAGGEAAPPGALPPTYENVIAAFRRIRDATTPGDHVYVHCSGYGLRVPSVAGPDRVDEALALSNGAGTSMQPLRDLEIGQLLGELPPGVTATLTLDCCHQIAPARGRHVAARGLGLVAASSRASAGVAPDHELAAAWREGDDRWLPPGSRHFLIRASGSSGPAYEHAFDGRTRNGALSYWLAHRWRYVGGQTYGELHDRLVTRVHSWFEGQTPVLVGDPAGVCLGIDEPPPRFSAPVLEIDHGRDRVRIGAGRAHGLRPRMRLSIHPMSSPERLERRSAIAEVDELRDEDCWALVPKGVLGRRISTGDRAVLLQEAVAMQMCRTVRVVADDDRPTRVDRSRALREIEIAVRKMGRSYVVLAEDAPGDLLVGVDADGRYEIADPAGQPISNLDPPIDASDADAAARVVRRLIHIVRYKALVQLENPGPRVALRNKLHVELLRGDSPPSQRRVENTRRARSAAVGDWLVLRVRNDAQEVLNIAAFDFHSKWGVDQFMPAADSASFLPLEPGQEQDIHFTVDLPSSASSGADVLKILATTDQATLRWIELPPLDAAIDARRRAIRDVVSPTEQILAAVALGDPVARELVLPVDEASGSWMTAEIEIHVHHAEGSSRSADLARSKRRVEELYAAGRFREAREAGRQLCEYIEAQLGEAHPDYAAAVHNLALLSHKVGEFDEAEALFQKTIRLRESAPAPQQLDLAGTYDALATLYRDRGNFDEAEAFYKKAQDVWTRAFKGLHPAYGASLSNLGSLHCERGRYAEAEQVLKRALEVIGATQGEAHPAFAACLNNLATMYKRMGHYGDAERYYRRAAEIFRADAGEEHPSYTATLHNLARLYHAMGRLDEAARLLQRVIGMERRTLGEDHTEFANSLDSLGSLYMAQGRIDDAADLIRRAAEIRRTKLGDKHPDYAASLNNLGEIAVAQKRYDEARESFEASLAIVRTIHGPHHPNVALGVRSLAALERRRGDLPVAELRYREALALDEVSFGPDDPRLTVDLEALAATLEEQGRVAEAKEALRRVAAILAKRLGDEHRLTRLAVTRAEAIHG